MCQTNHRARKLNNVKSKQSNLLGQRWRNVGNRVEFRHFYPRGISADLEGPYCTIPGVKLQFLTTEKTKFFIFCWDMLLLRNEEAPLAFNTGWKIGFSRWSTLRNACLAAPLSRKVQQWLIISLITLQIRRISTPTINLSNSTIPNFIIYRLFTQITNSGPTKYATWEDRHRGKK